MPHKLLLADDSITIQKVVGIIFSNEEYELTVVDNGDTALERAREIIPDVVLADALMPGRNGYELCREIRRDPSLGHVPTLLMTGVFEPFDENKAKECGADDFITKPFESQQLIEKVRKLIQSGPVRKAQAAPAAAPSAAPLQAAAQAPATPIQAKAPAIPAAFEFEEASPEDDLWGAIEIEDEETGEEVFFGEAVEEETAEAVEEEDYFREEEVAFAEEVPGTVEDGEEDFFAFEEEPAGFVTSAPEAAPAVEEDPFGDIDLSETYATQATQPAVFQTEAAVEFAEDIPAEEAFEFADEELEPAAAASSPFAAAPQVQAAPVEAAPFAPEPASKAAPAGEGFLISEEQLAAAVARISRELIERIAWEVVPDLAESLIRAEIRKIKEGA